MELTLMLLIGNIRTPEHIINSWGFKGICHPYVKLSHFPQFLELVSELDSELKHFLAGPAMVLIWHGYH